MHFWKSIHWVSEGHRVGLSALSTDVMNYHRDYDTDAYFSFFLLPPHLPTPFPHPSAWTALTLRL
jgi:hypothetical protein